MRVERFERVLTPTFCQQIIGGYSAFLEPAAVGEGKKKTYRSGRVAYNHEMEPSAMLSAMTIGMARKLDGGIEGMQPTHCDLICYTPGGGFSRHRDANAKQYTLIYFLNEGFEGGELEFDSGASFVAKTGDAVIWRNTPDSSHWVNTVTSGFRFVLAHWLVLP